MCADHVRLEDSTLTALMPGVHARQMSYFASQAAALGFTFIDLSGALREAAERLGPDALLYRADDPHFSALGHREAPRPC